MTSTSEPDWAGDSNGENGSHWDHRARRRVDELTAAVIEGRVSPAEQEALARLLSMHDGAQQAFLEQLGVEALLRGQEYRLGAAAVSRSHSVTVVQPAAGAWGKIMLISTLIASLLVAVGVGLLGSLRANQRPQRLATIVRTEQAQWGDERQAMLPNQGIGAGRLALKTGTAYLTTAFDVDLTLTAPCLVEFLDAKAVKVHDGRVKAKINNQTAVGFRVLTPSMDLVDLGTEFGVLVEQDGSSEVHVFQGVVVARALGAEQVVPIYRDEAGRVATEPKSVRDGKEMPSYRPTALVAVAARPDLFGQRRSTEAELTPATQELSPLASDSRILFIGDSYLDADTPLLLLEQAWHDAGWSPAPRLINGYVPDSIRQYTSRIEHHVLRYHPTHVVIGFGPQYATWPEDQASPEQFARDLAALIDRLSQAGIDSILATNYRFRPNQAEAQRTLDGYNDRIRDLAARRRLRLADVDRRFREAGTLDSLVDARARGVSFGASRLIVSAVLESFGQREIPVPGRLDLRPLPGVVTDWQFQLLPHGHEPLNAESAKQSNPDATWKPLHLPQDDRFTTRLGEPSHSPLYCERSCGCATNLTTCGLPWARACAVVRSDAERSAYLHVGAGTRLVWLNGVNVFDDKVAAPGGHGHHLGFETTAIALQAGENRLLVECNGSFFVSVTDSADPPRREF